MDTTQYANIKNIELFRFRAALAVLLLPYPHHTRYGDRGSPYHVCTSIPTSNHSLAARRPEIFWETARCRTWKKPGNFCISWANPPHLKQRGIYSYFNDTTHVNAYVRHGLLNCRMTNYVLVLS